MISDDEPSKEVMMINALAAVFGVLALVLWTIVLAISLL